VRIETTAVPTSDGLVLQADLGLPDPDTPIVASMVVAHPHPQYGGDRSNTVVDSLFRTLPRAGVAALRFDFRGVGTSEGVHDGGRAERLDVVAAIDRLLRAAPDVPLVLGGYSFGALVALDVADPRAAGWFAVAPPLAMAPAIPLAAADARPKHVVVPAHDQFTAPDTLRALVGSWAATTIDEIPTADHFLAGATAVVAETAVAFVHHLVSG
jgi:alpha/beta superfamily hydrolase